MLKTDAFGRQMETEQLLSTFSLPRQTQMDSYASDCSSVRGLV